MRQLFNVLFLALLATATMVNAQERSPGDVRLLTEVESALMGFGGTDFNVDTRRGIVQIAGFVDSMDARQEAEDAVGAVPGVEQVSNKLVVLTAVRSAEQKVEDNLIAGRIVAGLSENEATGIYDINVDVQDGVVLLSGFVDTPEEREAAAAVAGGIDGVQRVINGLDVVPKEATGGN